MAKDRRGEVKPGNQPGGRVFRSTGDDVEAADLGPDTAQTRSSSYRLAFMGPDFTLREDLRPVRLQRELLKPELCFQFHYFAIRKMHFLMRARGLVAFPGGSALWTNCSRR